jgi:hypothetical protein
VRSSTPDAHDDHTQINTHHHHPDPRLLHLAILGWGGFAAFFSHPALIALAITLLVLSGVAVLSGGNLSPGVREDRANRWVIIPFGLIGLFDAYLPAYTDRKGFWTVDGDVIRWRRSLRRRWRAADLACLCAQPSVQRTGSHPTRAYGGHEWSLWRHPPPELSRSAHQLAGWALAFRSGVGVLLTVLLIPPLVARIHAEETPLRSQFGGEYDVYRNRTPRLIPKFY